MLTLHNRDGHLIISAKASELWRIGPPRSLVSESMPIESSGWIELPGAVYASRDRFLNWSLQLVEQSPNHLWCRFSVDSIKPCAIVELRIPLVSQLTAMKVLNRAYEWKQVEPYEIIDSLTPGYMAGSADEGILSVRFTRHGALVWREMSTQFELILDHPGLHPYRIFDRQQKCVPRANSQRDHLGIECDVVFYLHRDAGSTVPGPVAWRYKRGALSCFVITDHADFDTTDGLRALLHGKQGFGGTSLRTTKSVFYRTKGYETPDKTFQPAGLDDLDFLSIIDEMAEAGHEICPHSVTPRPKVGTSVVPFEMLREALEVFSSRYHCGTWIDHGALSGQRFNYSQQGWNPDDEYYLCQILQDHGFSSIWSYVDTHVNPVQNINQLSNTDSWQAYFLTSFHSIARGRLGIGLAYAHLAIVARYGQEIGDWIRETGGPVKSLFVPGLSWSGRRKRFARLLTHPPRLESPTQRVTCDTNVEPFFPILYSETGRSLGQDGTDALVLFTTQRVNNYPEAWSELDRLIQERGIHIAHTYLCNNSRFVARTLEVHRGKWHVSPTFTSILSDLDRKVRQNLIWNPTLQECTKWFKSWSKVHIVQVAENAAVIGNPTEESLNEFCLLMPQETQVIFKNRKPILPIRGKPRLFSLNLPARSETKISWTIS